MKTLFILALVLAALAVLALVLADIFHPQQGDEEEDEHAQAVRPGPGLPHHRTRRWARR